jgi:hypothetical protein
MKLSAALGTACLVGGASSADAQFGSLGDKLKQAQDAKGKVDKKVLEIKISTPTNVSLAKKSVRGSTDFGVYQDQDVEPRVARR